jgi:hypothetical protein
MAGFRKTAPVLGVLLSLLSLVACNTSASATPTQDLNMLRTEVASTVLAQVSQTQSALPTVTPVLIVTSTYTPTPTSSSTSSLLPTLPPGASPVPSVSSIVTTPGLTAPAATSTPGQDRAQWVSQSILDGSVFAPGETFTMTWELENVGTSTWTANYLLRFYSGNTFSAIQEVPIGRDVPPGQTIEITVLMRAPITTGDYRSDWVMSNQTRSNFKEPVFLKMTVAASTATPRPTASGGT